MRKAEEHSSANPVRQSLGPARCAHAPAARCARGQERAPRRGRVCGLARAARLARWPLRCEAYHTARPGSHPLAHAHAASCNERARSVEWPAEHRGRTSFCPTVKRIACRLTPPQAQRRQQRRARRTHRVRKHCVLQAGRRRRRLHRRRRTRRCHVFLLAACRLRQARRLGARVCRGRRRGGRG